VQFGQRHRRAIGLVVCAIALLVAAVVTYSDPEPVRMLDLKDSVSGTGPEEEPGGSLTATVVWPREAAGVDLSDICVLAFDDDGGVVGGERGSLVPIAGQPAAGRWTVDGLADGRYTVYAALCVTPAVDARAWVAPQFLGGAADPESASWVDVEDGDRIDVGTITLRRVGLETWRDDT